MVPSTRWSPAWCSSTSTRWTPPSPRWAGCCGRAAGSSSSSTIRCCRRPGSGWIDDRILDEQYWRIGPYLVEDKTLEEVEKGIWIPFVHRPLSRYVNAIVAAGLLITRMEEPAPPPGFLARAHEYAEAATIPRLLFMRAEKLTGSAREGWRT